MGASFGTPTDRFGSGTEEEFNDALKALGEGSIKEVGFFFKNTPLESTKLNEHAISQLSKVIQFRESISNKGIYKNFNGNLELQTFVNEFLTAAVERVEAKSEKSTNISNSASEFYEKSKISSEFSHDFLNSVDKEIVGPDTEIGLERLWTEPDLKASLFTKDRGIFTEHFDSLKIAERLTNGGSFHITGQETAGKTALCGRLFLLSHARGYVPVYISGTEIKSSDTTRLQNKIRTQISQQYQGISQELAEEIPKNKIVIIIDDFDAISLSAKLAISLLRFLKSTFLSVAVTTSVTYSFAVFESANEMATLGELTRAEIQEVGHKKRYDLIENWYRAKLNGDSSETRLRYQVEQARTEINRILLNHIVPRTPVIVLILLRAIDNSQASDLAQSGYVRYYKFLIDNAILRTLSLDEAERAYALLPELAWAIYNSPSEELKYDLAERAIDAFAERRALRKSTLYSVLESLRRIGMFQVDQDVLRFKYSYAYNFFLADYMAKNIAQLEIREHIKMLCGTSWSQRTATILIFLSFHSNDAIIIESLISQLEHAYKNVPEFDFGGKKLDTINGLVSVSLNQEIDSSKAKENRELRLKAQDETAARLENNGSKDQSTALNEMERVFAAVDVLGHILRNHYAKIDADPKRQVFMAATSAILRCIGSFSDFLSDSTELLVGHFSNALKTLEGDSAKQASVARMLVFLLATGFLYLCGKKLSQAVGDQNLEITYAQALKSKPAVAQQYLDLILKLDCFFAFPVKELEDLIALLKGNHVAISALQLAVAERLDMRPPSSAAEFQRCCKIVGLKEVPRLLERQRRGSEPQKQKKSLRKNSKPRSKR
jgi:hypothetical protein